ncbi:D-2-hydroxyacid dehydrogenase [Chromobacterium sp. IIBBL 290-4]|uniref:D-2-hydroxyacid dehydrogenase n=1 Tax=Chromobacterium sp. IIBBL 290-4 TaxID=2953890 RepID=UPI0020B74761|nr:D-2-hydroxyacid dehydrogenase [Chromobacterium sp. IIBBL 290-4]UTH72303.1 D-2-hydroxyacid dehydrogenase [Chromobacterium sp. IIBBL 290-4]
MTFNVVFLDRDSLPVPVPVFSFPSHYCEYPATSGEQLLEHAADADILISNKVPIGRDALARLPRLKLIAIAATGYNHIDVAACRERGVAVCNIRHYGDHTVAEHAFMLMMTLLKNLPAYQRDVAAGVWSQAKQFCHFGAPIREARGATLAIVGSGGIGGELAQMARAFGMEVIFAERKGAAQAREGKVLFEQALARADVVSLHCPLNDETRGMIAQAELMAMKPGAILINTARGGLVDEADLVAALKYGQLGGAGFDVLSAEPPAADNPLLKARLPNLIVTPHVGWASGEAMARLAAQLAGNIEAFVQGEPRNLVS